MRQPNISYREGDDIEPVNWSKMRVEEYATKVAKLFDFKPGEDLGTMVTMLGGEVHYRELDDLVGESGSVFVHRKYDFDILLPIYTSKTRDRFTIAHELGHYFLHSNQGEIPLVAYRSGSTRIEWEANWFAASLVMPADEFKTSLRQLNGRIESVAFQFGVSVEAAKVRQDALGTR
jgi:Zn-dependent peptidase ImmA (M78 family)